MDSDAELVSLNVSVDSLGIIRYLTYNGVIHRELGPAVIYPSGSLIWYRHGELHREDGPAVIQPSGLQMWMMNGAPHRVDGPAVIYANGHCKWFHFEVEVKPFEPTSDEKTQ